MDTITPELVDDLASARMTDRTSGRSARVEILPRAERRRSWTLEEKRAIVSESLGPELTPTDVARKHGLSTGQIYTWRNQLLSVRGSAPLEAPRFASVELMRSNQPSPASPPAQSSAVGLSDIASHYGFCSDLLRNLNFEACRHIRWAVALSR